MQKILSFSRLLLYVFSYVIITISCVTTLDLSAKNNRTCKRQNTTFSKKPKLSQKQSTSSLKAYNNYLEKKGVNGFKEAIKILKASFLPNYTMAEKKIAAKKTHEAMQKALKNYKLQENKSLNQFGINDKALSNLLSIATAEKLAPFYVAGTFNLQDLNAVEQYINQGGRDEELIKQLLHM